MSIENKQEQLIVPVERGSTSSVESIPEIPAQTIQNIPIVPQESVASDESIETEKRPTKKDSPRIILTGAGDGVGWFALIDRKEEGDDIEVL